mgnify:CR=1 FL=1
MAKTKSRRQKKTTPPLYERKFGQLKELFPKVTITKWSEKNPGKSGKDFIMDVILPNNYTLISKVVSSNGEITLLSFSVQKKHCTENQKPGVYRFSA